MEPINISFDLTSSDYDCGLGFDENGQIVKDACLKISNFTIDNIELGHTVFEQCKYHHDFNGSQDPVVDKFYGDMGCNGTLIFLFQSPIYIWLLVNM